MGSSICAGFPSPADDYLEEALDAAALIVTNPTATFIWRVAGDSMRDRKIHTDDYVVVDRSLKAVPGDVVVAVIDDTVSLKQLVRRGGSTALDVANSDMAPLVLDEAAQASIWGVVTWSLTRHRELR